MFLRNKKGVACLALAACMLFTTEFEVLAANPQSEAQAMNTVNLEMEMAPLADAWDQIAELADVAVDTQDWEGKAIANTDKTVDVCDGTGKVIGKMYKNTVVKVLDKQSMWTKISSGKVKGFVKTESLLFGSEAVERAEKVCKNGTSEITEFKQSSPAMTVNASDEKLLAFTASISSILSISSAEAKSLLLSYFSGLSGIV